MPLKTELDLITLEIHPDVAIPIFNLNIPVVRLSTVGPLFDPNSAFDVHIALLSSLRPVSRFHLDDFILAPFVGFEFRNKRNLP